MPAPVLSKVDMTGIAPMGFSYRQPQAALSLRNHYQVDVIRHETICPYIDFVTPAGIGHQGNILVIIIVAEKSLHPAVAPLSNMVRYSHDSIPLVMEDFLQKETHMTVPVTKEDENS